MHTKGIIHRDVKPANIFITDGCGKVGDFGIAKETGIANAQTGVQSTRGIGTLKYMPPEIETRSASTEWDVSPASDVWAFGIVLLDAAGVEINRPLCTRGEVEEAISKIPRQYGPEFRRVVMAALAPHSRSAGSQRPPAMDLLQLPFFMHYYSGWFKEYVPKVAIPETTMFLSAYRP
jgi:serine/threonine protein kinase